MVNKMKETLDLLDQKIYYAAQEGKVIGDEFLIKVAIQSWESRELEHWSMGSETQAVETICVPGTEYIWVKVSKEIFEKFTLGGLDE